MKKVSYVLSNYVSPAQPIEKEPMAVELDIPVGETIGRDAVHLKTSGILEYHLREHPGQSIAAVTFNIVDANLLNAVSVSIAMDIAVDRINNILSMPDAATAKSISIKYTPTQVSVSIDSGEFLVQLENEFWAYYDALARLLGMNRRGLVKKFGLAAILHEVSVEKFDKYQRNAIVGAYSRTGPTALGGFLPFHQGNIDNDK